MKDERVLLKSYLKTLKLPTITREYQAIARASAKSNEPYEKYLQRIHPIPFSKDAPLQVSLIESE